MAETDSAVVGGSSSSITDNKTPPDDEPPTSTQFVDETASPSSTSPNHLGLSCEMCRNYEINLTNLQDEERKTREELKAVVALSNRYESELSAERQYRKELEEKMSAKCRETEEQIAAAAEDFEKLKERIVKLEEQQDEERKVSLQKLADLAKANEDLEKEFSVMTAKYTKLLGTNRARASEMRAAAIELPTDVDQLQFACLQLREELIESRSAKEHVENELRGEIALLRETREAEKANAEAMERSLVAQVNELNASLGIANSQLSALGESSTRMEENSRTISDLKATVAELEAQIQQVQGERQALEQTCANYRNRCMTLQQELDTTEGVQKDFVKLSQNLQIQLEKIRQSSTEVRWQFDEDVDQCPECRVSLVRVRPRPHCLHCGKIFCAPCLRQTIPSGPHRRPAPVCQVCHTLLNRESAPFFSQQ